MSRQFPILRNGKDARAYPDARRSVPWVWVAPHAAQAKRNHDQSIERLAERGGLGPNELHALVHGRNLRHLLPRDEAERWLAQWDGRPGTLEPGWTGPRCSAVGPGGRCTLPEGHHEDGAFDVTTIPKEHEFAPFGASETSP